MLNNLREISVHCPGIDRIADNWVVMLVNAIFGAS